jgi:hypothetical protein
MAGQKKHPIGTGQSGHSGNGKAQSGAGNWGGGVAVSNQSGPIVGDGIGHGKGYQTSAHSDNYHHGGEAVGHITDIKPMHYSSTLHGEGNSEIHTDGSYGRAAHHKNTSMGGAAHTFPNNKSGMGYGHSASQMKGPLRMSGHKGAHRIGCK